MGSEMCIRDRPVWAGLYKAINTYLDSITLQDLLEQEHKNDDYSYVI